MYMVQTAWPQANLVGVDMSTYKLAISQAKLEKKPEHMQSKVRQHAPDRSIVRKSALRCDA